MDYFPNINKSSKIEELIIKFGIFGKIIIPYNTITF